MGLEEAAVVVLMAVVAAAWSAWWLARHPIDNTGEVYRKAKWWGRGDE